MNKIYIIILLISFQTTYSQNLKNYLLVIDDGKIDTIYIKNKSKIEIDNMVDSIFISNSKHSNESSLLKKMKNETQNSNVLFIHFEEDKTFCEKEISNHIESFESYKYIFSEDYYDNITLSYSKYRDFDAQERGEKQLFFTLNKSFKNNKKLILKNETIKKLGKIEFLKLIRSKEKVFVFVESVLNKQIIVKEVIASYPSIE